MMSGLASSRLKLREPSEDLAESYRALVAEFVERGEDLVPFPLCFEHNDFPKFLERLSACSRGENLPPGFVAHSTYWLVLDDAEVVGVSNLRHQLTDALRRDGGVLDSEEFLPKHDDVVQRYWITLQGEGKS